MLSRHHKCVLRTAGRLECQGSACIGPEPGLGLNLSKVLDQASREGRFDFNVNNVTYVSPVAREGRVTRVTMIARRALPLATVALALLVPDGTAFRPPSSRRTVQSGGGGGGGGETGFAATKRQYRTCTTSTGTGTTSLLPAAISPNDIPDSPYDLCVIGAGPVGVSAALQAARLSKSVVLVDAPRASGALMNEATGEDLSIGGPTGLFSKALRDAGKKISVSSLKGMGLRDESVWNEVVTTCVELASYNARDTVRQLEYAGVTYCQGLAQFTDSGGTDSLFVTSEDNSVSTVNAKNILIATGSTPFRPGGIPFDGRRVFDSDSINTLGYLPKSVAITGSGIIAIGALRRFWPLD